MPKRKIKKTGKKEGDRELARDRERLAKAIVSIIRMQRLKENKSQAEVAAFLEWTVDRYSNVERLLTGLPFVDAVLAAWKLNMSTEELFRRFLYEIGELNKKESWSSVRHSGQ